MTTHNRPKISLSSDELPWMSTNGVRSASFAVGAQDDADAPVVLFAEFPPDAVVGAHTHDTDYAEIMLEGSQYIDRRWHTKGDIRIVRAGTVYGPIRTGPEGAKVTIVFRTGQHAMRAPRDGEAITVQGKDAVTVQLAELSSSGT
jgi:nucleoside-diphosphate-sugar epimerase